jgi:hypothetical protein
MSSSTGSVDRRADTRRLQHPARAQSVADSVTLREQGQTTVSGLRLYQEMTFETWLGLGRQLARISSASAWCLGDWLVYGERAYGQRYRAALEVTSLDYQTLRNYAWVARRFELSRRRDRLSFQHHAEVAWLSEAEQDLWLQRAERSRWTRNELRRRLAARRRQERHPTGNDAVVLRMQVGAVREERWRQAAIAAEQDFVDWIASALDQVADSVLDPHTAKASPGGNVPPTQWDDTPAEPASPQEARRR